VGAFRKLATLLFILAIPVALVTTNLRFLVNEPLGSTQPAAGRSDGAASMLVLAGSASDGSLSLTVFDYSRGITTATLYG